MAHEDILVVPEEVASDVRGSAPVMTTKDLLLEMRLDVKEVRRVATILESQHLDDRLNDVEKWQSKVDGRMSMITAGVPVISGIVAVLSALAGIYLVGHI